jgi:hypothetical protein
MSDSGLTTVRSRLWLESRLVRETAERSGIESHVRSLSNLGDAFRLRDRALRCIDGRTPGGVHLAGSGVLLGLEKAQAFAQAARVDRVTYHGDCGAARACAVESGRDAAEAAACGREFAEQLAAALSVPCAETPLVGPPEFHWETAVYYDGTGRADPSRVSGLPKGFVISRLYFGDDFPAALDEVRLAVGLAFSDLGFADLFTHEHPLRLAAIGAPSGSGLPLDQLLHELGLLDLPERDRTVIEGFVGR